MQPQLTHVGIYAKNIDTMADFYRSIFGLVVTDRGRSERMENVELVFLSGDIESHHQLVLIGWPPSRPHTPSNVHQLSFKVASLAELRAVEGEVRKAGVAPTKPVDHGNAWSVYSSDPEGNGIEIYLDSPWYVAQPHARPLDLSLSDKALRAVTEAAVKADPTHTSRPEWQHELQHKLSTAARHAG